MLPLRTSERIIWNDRSEIAMVHVEGFAVGGVSVIQP